MWWDTQQLACRVRAQHFFTNMSSCVQVMSKCDDDSWHHCSIAYTHSCGDLLEGLCQHSFKFLYCIFYFFLQSNSRGSCSCSSCCFLVKIFDECFLFFSSHTIFLKTWSFLFLCLSFWSQASLLHTGELPHPGVRCAACNDFSSPPKHFAVAPREDTLLQKPGRECCPPPTPSTLSA